MSLVISVLVSEKHVVCFGQHLLVFYRIGETLRSEHETIYSISRYFHASETVVVYLLVGSYPAGIAAARIVNEISVGFILFILSQLVVRV